MPQYQVVKVTTDKLEGELNRRGPHELFSVTFMGGRDWVVISRAEDPVINARPHVLRPGAVRTGDR